MLPVRRSFLFIMLVVLSWFTHRCAQVQPPTGGPKDQDPPEVARAVPSNGSVNFQGDAFVLNFNEYVRTRQMQQELIVSPPLDEDPEITLKGKELLVEWDEELKADQTYSFRFGSSIQDITEGNSADNLVYAFSTGDRLDSLHFQGKVVDARTREPVEGALAMLYRQKADSVPRTRKPYYFSETDEKGRFDIPYLANGRYKFFALKDQNRNYRFDLPNEGIAFLREPVRPYKADSTGETLARLFVEEEENQFVEEKTIEPGKAFFKLKRGAEKVGVTLPGDSSLPWDHFKLHRSGSDSVTYWFPDREMPDSTALVLKADTGIRDTFIVRHGAAIWEEDSVFDLQKSFEDPLDRNESAALETSYPLRTLDTSSILAVSDSDTVDLGARIGGAAQRRLVLEQRELLESKVSLTLFPGALVDTFGRRNTDTLYFSFKVRESDHYGKLSLFLRMRDSSSEQVILRLLDKSGNTVRKNTDSTGHWIRFPYLQPGPLRLELILDRVPNGEWDPGEYPDRQPEPVRYYPDTVKVRSNWEQEIEWKEIDG